MSVTINITTFLFRFSFFICFYYLFCVLDSHFHFFVSNQKGVEGGGLKVLRLREGCKITKDFGGGVIIFTIGAGGSSFYGIFCWGVSSPLHDLTISQDIFALNIFISN